MRSVLIALAMASMVATAAVEQAHAADIPAPVLKAAPFSPLSPRSYAWSGFYVGVHLGYGFGDNDVDLGLIDGSGTLQAAAAAGAFATTFSVDRNGVLGGAQVGYNMQSDQWVWGVEADFSGSDISGSQTIQLPAVGAFPNQSSVSQNMDWFGTLRLRGGYAMNNWLFYATAGLAYGHVKYSYLQTNTPFGGTINTLGSDSSVEVGWTAGAGVEYGWGQWSGRLEYLYYDLGNHNYNIQFNTAPAGVFIAPNFHNSGSIVRVGLNYRFGSGFW